MTARSLQAWDLGIITEGEFHKTGRTHSRRIRDAYIGGEWDGVTVKAYWERWDDGCAASQPETVYGPVDLSKVPQC